MDEEQNPTPESTDSAATEQKPEPTENTATQPQPEAVTPVAQPAAAKKSFGERLKSPVAMAVIAVLVLLGGAVGFLALTSDDDEMTNEEPVVQQPAPVTTLGAAVATIEGTVETSTDSETWTAAEAGQSLANLDYVRTLADSRAIILFDDGSVTRLDSNTELYLSSLEADALEVTLMSGQVYSRVVESENQTFTVVTANERFEALGTAYKTATDGTKDDLEVYQSEVKVTSEDLNIAEGNKYDTDSKVQSAIDLAALDADEFAQWNKQKDSESDDFKDKLGVLKDREEAPAPAPTNPGPSDGISLSASQSSKGVALSWTLTGVSSSQGFKVVRDKSTSAPQYGVHEAIYVGDGASRSTTWWDDNGGTHYYRVCIYFEGTCSTYSNAVQVTSPLVEKEPVVSGDVSLSISGNTLSWSLVGGTAPHGYKVLLSDSPSPTYPANSIKYTADTAASLPDKAAGTYYVRVCKYTNGTQEAGCVDYSNEVEYVVTP